MVILRQSATAIAICERKKDQEHKNKNRNKIHKNHYHHHHHHHHHDYAIPKGNGISARRKPNCARMTIIFLPRGNFPPYVGIFCSMVGCSVVRPCLVWIRKVVVRRMFVVTMMMVVMMLRFLRRLAANMESGMFRGAGLRHVRTVMIFHLPGMMIIISGKRCSSLNTGVARAYEASGHHPSVTFTTRAPGNIPPCPSPQPPRDHHHQYHRHHRQHQHPALPYGIPHQPSKAVPTHPLDPTPMTGRRPPRPIGICTTRTRNAARASSTTRSMQSVP